jgi:hypothetical protein
MSAQMGKSLPQLQDWTWDLGGNFVALFGIGYSSVRVFPLPIFHLGQEPTVL